MDVSNTLPATIEEVRSRIRSGWDAFATDIARYTPEQLANVTDAEGWTIKDHIAHIAQWERSIIGIVRNLTPPYETLGFEQDVWLHNSLDWINNQMRERTCHLSAEDVLVLSKATHAELEGVMQESSFDDLNRRLREGDKQSPLILELVLGDTEEHYNEHRGWSAAIAADRTTAKP